MDPRIPADVFNGREYTSIHAAVLFADLENSVLISSALSTQAYDELVDGFQRAMTELVKQFRASGMPIGESYVLGDQLSLFFYDPKEIERNWRLDGPDPVTGAEREALIAECRKSNDELVFKALQAAILLKSSWLIQEFNFKRVLEQQEPWGLGIGIHSGNVFLRDRPDGLKRIEGYAVNLAKRVEGASRYGRYSHIMLSQQACNTIRGSTREHSQLRQRIFFQEHNFNVDVMKGVTRSQPVYELKFFSRIGMNPELEAVRIYDSIFAADAANSWAYYQLVDHYAYVEKDWRRVFELAARAYIMNPNDEKILLDLARFQVHQGNLSLAIDHCEQALRINPEFDLVYELLGVIYNKREEYEACARSLRKAVQLSPRSAVNNLNLGLLLMEHKKPDEALLHIQEAISLYPKYLKEQQVLDALEQLGISEENFGNAAGAGISA